jgi:hypothetical protein
VDFRRGCCLRDIKVRQRRKCVWRTHVTCITDIPLKSTSRTKAHSKFVKNHPSLQRNTMGRADKSAQVTKAVLAIRSGEYMDYSNAANKFHYSRTAVMRRITGKTKTR